MNGLYDEFRIVLHGIWQRRWLALAVGWAVCLAGWLIVSMIPNAYESQARIFVQRPILPDSIGITPVQQQQEVDRVRQTLGSGVNLEKVVRGTDLAHHVASDRDVAEMVTKLAEGIRVDSLQDNLFTITAAVAMPGLSDADNARLSHDVVQKLIDIFVEENITGNRNDTAQTLRFLDTQLAQREKQLQEAEQKRMAFDQQFMDLLPGTGSVSDRMSAARAELVQVDSNLAAAQSALGTVNGQMAATPASEPGAAYTGPAGARLATIEGQLADARSKGWTDNHPDVIALRNQLGAARAAAAGERKSGGGGAQNPMWYSLRTIQAEKQANVAALNARKNQLQSELAQIVAKQTAEPGIVAEQAQISRNYDVLKAQHDKIFQDREDVRLRGDVQSDTDAVKFRVIDPPSSPRIPTAPNRPLLLALVLVLGIGAGAATAFVKGQLNTTYPTAQRLEKASGLPVIGSISTVLTTAERDEQRKRNLWFAGGLGSLAGVFALLLLVEFVQRGMVA
ncbi:XrtA system polysaccharide chain length determinant [Sphingobium boeckii]|uniref:Polysaccharide chain length determinant protein (PEP-CTERM system associated) n=1 Tax=Sphingobium boeckii TaxID=1082345 RepID=A0A7W9AKL7_9SPHN|nr:XrtA system polysaccharide chain length determinant [Sphingobium boeckii]MBB5687397.1 polysaccharide chain length determinant protein (PEP-CTERM system associated) [Sphingobium boeckii]